MQKVDTAEKIRFELSKRRAKGLQIKPNVKTWHQQILQQRLLRKGFVRMLRKRGYQQILESNGAKRGKDPLKYGLETLSTD